jgi:uncharacterized protein YbcI
MDGREPEEGNLSGGELLTAISNRIVAIMREHYGRGPTKAKTYVLDDVVVCVLRNGFTPIEQSMVNAGEPERVVAMRQDFQRLMAEKYKAAIRELTGRNVVAFLSQAHLEPDLTLEIFFVDGPLPGFGAVEVHLPEEGLVDDSPEPTAEG